MPAPYARRDAIQSLARAVNRTSRGQAQGRLRGLSPTVSGVGRPTRTDPAIADVAIMHHIQGWDIADDTVATFTLDFLPQLNSWNLHLNGIRVHRDSFSISGRTVTIANPTVLFLGADTQDTPWDLEIQYDCVPDSVPPPTFPQTGAAGEQASPASLTFAAPPGVGHSVLLVYNSKFSGGITGTVTGLGATWTKIVGVSGGVGGDSRPSELWVGTGCDGADDTITLVGGDSVFGLYALEVDTALTATGEQHDSDVSATTTGPITSTGSGVAVSVMLGSGSGPVDAPVDGWVTLQALTGPHPRCMYRPTSSGDTVQLTTSTAFGHALIAVVKYA